MDSGEESPRPSTRRRVSQAENDSDDEMLGNGQTRFNNGAEDDEGQSNGQQQADLAAYEMCRVDPDPFIKDADPFVVTGLQSARELMDSLRAIFDPAHYHAEAYAGVIAKVFCLPVTEPAPDFTHIMDAVLHEIHEGSAVAVKHRIEDTVGYAASLINGIRAMLMAHRTHPDVASTYETNCQFLDTFLSQLLYHGYSLRTIIAQKTGDLQVMADAAIDLKPYEDLKDQVKLQKHLTALFQAQNNRVFADKVMRQKTVPVLLASGQQAHFKTRSWSVLYRDPMGGTAGSMTGTSELNVETWVDDNLDTSNDLILEWSASSSEKKSAREALRINHKVSIAAAQRHLFSFAHGDDAVIYDIRADKTYHMGDGLPEHIMVGGFHPRPFKSYEDYRDGGFWDGNWFDIPTALDQVCLQIPRWCIAAASLCKTFGSTKPTALQG